MSSYLNFFLVPKAKNEEKPQPMLLDSFSRLTAIYQSFNDVLTIPAVYTEEEKYMTLTNDDLADVLESINKSMKFYEGLKTESLKKKQDIAKHIANTSALAIEATDDEDQIKKILTASTDALQEALENAEQDAQENDDDELEELRDARSFVCLCMNLVQSFRSYSDFEAIAINIG